jgi:ribonuclease Z
MQSNPQTKITFLGTSTATPDIGSDTASFLINDRYLVDTGWSVVHNLRTRGIDPNSLDCVLFTHFHHDHYLSLPSLLFYFLNKKKSMSDVTFIGPANDLERVTRMAMDFLQAEHFYPNRGLPTFVPLQPGDAWENEGFRIETCSTIHPVQGLCYRFFDKISNKTFSFTGDTAPHPPIVEHVKGSELLITEASLGPVAANPEQNVHQHSGAIDAGRLAQQAEVGRLLMVHGPAAKAEECIREAQLVCTAPVEWPKDGQTYWL